MSRRFLMTASLAALIAVSATARASTVAYTSLAGTVGNQKYGFSFGMDFIPKDTINVTALGLYSSTGKGFSGTDYTVLFDEVTHAVLARTEFSASAPGALTAGTADFFKTLAKPILLTVGHEYTIASFMPKDFLANAGISSLSAPVETGSADLSYVGLGRFAMSGNQNTYPTTVDMGPANRYSGPTFAFVKVPEPTSVALMGIGLIVLSFCMRRGRLSEKG